MICVICRQDEVRSGKATVVFERDGTTVVFKGVRPRGFAPTAAKSTWTNP